MPQDKKGDAISEAYSNQGDWQSGGEERVRDVDKITQSGNKYSPEEYQKKINENRSSDIAKRQAYLASKTSSRKRSSK